VRVDVRFVVTSTFVVAFVLVVISAEGARVRLTDAVWDVLEARMPSGTGRFCAPREVTEPALAFRAVAVCEVEVLVAVGRIVV
jgi:hypothetical protein